VVIRYIKEGYIKDDDAKNWNADDLLKNLKDGVEESNKDRVARGFPEMQVIGWVQPPSYDAATHRLVWSLLAKDKGEPDSAAKSINYNTYALGRDGYFSLNLLSNSERIAGDKAVAHELLGDLAYNAGKRYEDFSASTDRIAEYGLMALVGGVAAKKLGLFAVVAAFVLKFAKVILIGLGCRRGRDKFLPSQAAQRCGRRPGVKALFLLSSPASNGASSPPAAEACCCRWWSMPRYGAGVMRRASSRCCSPTRWGTTSLRGSAASMWERLPSFRLLGAWIALKDQPVDVETEAYVAIAGPVVGTIAALAVYLWARSEIAPVAGDCLFRPVPQFVQSAPDLAA
jgi:hypothetical protein